jgi:hypothetical protein
MPITGEPLNGLTSPRAAIRELPENDIARYCWPAVDNRLTAQSRTSDRRRVVSTSRAVSAFLANHPQRYRRTL